MKKVNPQEPTGIPLSEVGLSAAMMAATRRRKPSAVTVLVAKQNRGATATGYASDSEAAVRTNTAPGAKSSSY